MARYERSQESSAPPQRVWSIWSDPSTWPAWNPDVRSVTMDVPFASGATGSMTTGAGTHQITLENVAEGRSFELVTKPIPATTFRFRCEISPAQSGSHISQGVTMSGPIAPLFSLFMGNRIAESFRPILAGLAKEAENASTGG